MDGYIAIDKNGDYIFIHIDNFDSNYSPVEANIYKVSVKSNSYSKLFTGTYFYGVGVVCNRQYFHSEVVLHQFSFKGMCTF
jgi:hypothetical protein